MEDGEKEQKNAVREYYEEEAEYHGTLYDETADMYPANIIRANIAQGRLESQDDVVTVIDIGCGTGEVTVQLLDAGFDVYGFDFASNMVDGARDTLEDAGYDRDRITQGDVMEEIPFDKEFDAAIALGVLPHFKDIRPPLEQFESALREGGHLVAQLRNDLFDMFTFNEYTYEFLQEELLVDISLEEEAETALDERIRDHLNLESGVGESAGDADFTSGEQQYFHNPLIVDEQFEAVGFAPAEHLFYHYHAMLPEFETEFREEFYKQSLHIEDPHDWRGHFLASAFLIHARA